MARASELSLRDLRRAAVDLVIISPNDPAAMTKYAQEAADLAIPYIYDPSQQIARLNAADIAHQLADQADAADAAVGDGREVTVESVVSAFRRTS